MKQTKMVFLSTVIVALMAKDTDAFTSPVSHPFHGSQLKGAPLSIPASHVTVTKTTLAMLDQTSTTSVFTMVSPLLSMSFVTHPFASHVTATPTYIDPVVEAELLTDMAHVALDFVAFFGPATMVIRLMAIIGRLFTIGADYVPDHAMNIEEVIFQAVMLAMASSGFIQSIMPAFLATSTQTTFRDSRIFLKTFSRAGMSWMQYKTMAAVALDWIQVDGGTIIMSEEMSNPSLQDYFFFLYEGSVSIHSQGEDLIEVTTPSLLGEIQFARKLDGELEETDFPKTTIKAGVQGATLLRIHSSKLVNLMKNDDKLAKSIRSLIFKAMQEKLSSAMTRKAMSAKIDCT